MKCGQVFQVRVAIGVRIIRGVVHMRVQDRGNLVGVRIASRGKLSEVDPGSAISFAHLIGVTRRDFASTFRDE